jgi:hypothetical protein
VQIREWQFFYRPPRFFKFTISLTWKAGHHIRANGSIRHGRANFLQFIVIVPRTILPVHASQNGVAGRLHGHMRVLGNARRLRHERDQFITPIHRLN